MIVSLLEVKVEGIGCGSCVAPSKEHFIKVEGIMAVHVHGSRVYIIYDPSKTNPRKIIRESGVENYYFIRIIGEEKGEYDILLSKIKPTFKLLK